MSNKIFDSFRRWRRGLSESERIHVIEFLLFLILFASLSLALAAVGFWFSSMGALGVVAGLITAKGFGADREDLARAGSLAAAVLVVCIMLQVVFSGAKV